MITEVSTDSPRCQLISDDEKELLRSVSMRELVEQYGVKVGRDRYCLCPVHEERSPSCEVYANHMYCHACKRALDPIQFLRETQGLGFRDACKELARMFGITLGCELEETDDEREDRIARQREKIAETERKQIAREQKEARERKEKRSRWPQFCIGRKHDLQEVADLRGIHYAGPWLAQELGLLHFATWLDKLAWIIADERGGRARRLDGQDWTHGNSHKSDSLGGSETQCVGLTESLLPVMLVEGEGDFLTALAWLWERGEHERWELVCMFGASASLGDDAKLLAGREGVIYAHSGKAGMDGARRWKAEAIHHGAEVIINELPHGKDLNDLYREGAL